MRILKHPSTLVFAAFLMGVINPLILLTPTLKLANPLWNSLFGIGWFSMEALFGPNPLIMGGWQSVFGMSVWPVILCVLLFYFLRIAARASEKSYWIVSTGFWVSMIIVVPIETMISGSLSFLPSYAKYFLIFG
ncbi:MAG: hypothetical protein ABI810_00425 [Sphingomonas bacterium]